MENHFYILQYHIYAVAVHKYLKTRMPKYAYEKNFGGIYYIFLRGASAQHIKETGIYRARPEKDLIDGIESAFNA